MKKQTFLSRRGAPVMRGCLIGIALLILWPQVSNAMNLEFSGTIISSSGTNDFPDREIRDWLNGFVGKYFSGHLFYGSNYDGIVVDVSGVSEAGVLRFDPGVSGNSVTTVIDDCNNCQGLWDVFQVKAMGDEPGVWYFPANPEHDFLVDDYFIHSATIRFEDHDGDFLRNSRYLPSEFTIMNAFSNGEFETVEILLLMESVDPADPENQNTFNYLGKINMVNPVPEPATMFLLGTGLVVLVGSRLRQKKN